MGLCIAGLVIAETAGVILAMDSTDGFGIAELAPIIRAWFSHRTGEGQARAR
jgi:hypothetical protein